ncbi:alpha/beta fold hydrolase [Streptomyces olivochromogenes]|uniref:alpha/beta fold hydrolase n=1 Tax=Streptomyces olivochromogenes TaxID=1963 RepID=UPI0036A1C3C1
MRTERIGTSDVRFRRQGEGDFAAVFVHGFLDDQYVWDGLIGELATPGIECVTLDLAGSGDRTQASGPFTYDRFADEVGAVADALGKPFVIVGQSLGSAVAELVAAQRPDQALGLVLVTPVPLAGTRQPDEVMDAFRSLGGDGDAQRAVRTQLSASLAEADLDRLVVSGTRMRPETVREAADCWNDGHPAGEQPSRYTGPVLIVRGEDDGFVTDDSVAQGVAPRFAAPETVAIGQAGHWAHLEQPTHVASHLDRFLARALPAVQASAWTNAFEEKSADEFSNAFAADVTLEASALTRTVEGRDQVKNVMAAASTIYDSLVFTQETVSGERSYLEWQATAFGGTRIDGVTILTKNAAGQIVRAAIHHRPLGAVHRFSAELGRRLNRVLDAEYFHRG